VCLTASNVDECLNLSCLVSLAEFYLVLGF
jgi:hypothetical protein